MATAYAFDTTGAAPANLIQNELHTANESNFFNTFFIVPQFAPFYLNNLVVSATTNGVKRTLDYGIDYNYVFKFKAASRSIGTDLYGGLRLVPSSVNPTDIITLQYQTLGGEWTVDPATALDTLLAEGFSEVLSVWDILTEYADTFPAVNHATTFDPATGVQCLLDALNDLAVAIASQDRLSKIVGHLTDYNNPHQDTAATFGLQDMENIPFATPLEVSQGASVHKYISFDQLLVLMNGVTAANQNTTSNAGLNVQGPLTIKSGTPTNYLISDFDSRTTYTLTADLGTAVLNGDTIVYTPPMTLGQETKVGGFKLNTIDHPVTVQQTHLLAPTITFPSSGASVGEGVTFDSSAISTDGGPETEVSATWELATDVGFTTIVQQSVSDTTNLLSWKATGLTTGTTYYARVKYTSTYLGDTNWSNTVSVACIGLLVPSLELQTLYPTDMSADDVTKSGGIGFGQASALAKNGSVYAVGAQNKIVSGLMGAGQVYIYGFSNGQFNLIQTLTEPTPTTYSYFGATLAISGGGETLAVSAAGATNSYATIYIYRLVSGSYQLSKTIDFRSTYGTPSHPFGPILISDDGNTVFFPYITGDESASIPLVLNFATYTFSAGDWTGISEVAPTIPETLTAIVSPYSVFAASADCSTIAVAVDFPATHYSVTGYSHYVFKKTNGNWVVHPFGEGVPNYILRSASVSMNRDGTLIALGRIRIQVSPTQAWVEDVYITKLDSNGLTVLQTIDHPVTNVNNFNDSDMFAMAVAMSSTGNLLAVSDGQDQSTGTAVDQINFYSTTDGSTWTFKSSVPTTIPQPSSMYLTGDGSCLTVSDYTAAYTNASGTLDYAGKVEVFK